MPTPTYDLISTTTLAAATSSVTFSGFPTDGTYRDLVLVASVTNPSGGTSNVNIRFNGDSGANYNHVSIFGTGSAATQSGSNTTNSINFPLGGTENIGSIVSQIMDYSATDKHKTFLTRIADKGGYGDYVIAAASRWANTSTVTSVTVFGTANFQIGNIFNLYGIAA